MIHMWRLSEAGPDNLGPTFTDEGLVLGQTQLIERRNGRFVVRERAEIERLWKRAHFSRRAPSVDSLMPGLATVAAALNADDQCLARIATVHLKIPDLQDIDGSYALEVEDALIKLAFVQSGAPASEDAIGKASPDDPKHPGWPKGTEGGRGGQFRPKTDAELTQQIKSRIARRGLRLGLLTILHVGLDAIGNLMPGVDVAADVALVAEIARTVSEFRKLAVDAATAFDFAKEGPHTLEELQVSSSRYEEFSSYDGFVKGEPDLELIFKRFGGAGAGNQYHHIVTQGGENGDKIPAERLQNTDNIVVLPTILHEAVNAVYSGSSPVKGMTLYQWLQTQPYDVQREIGIKILRELNIIK